MRDAMMNIKTVLGMLLFLLPALGVSAVPSWQIIPAESNLTFIATQNDAPTSGTFKVFSGEIKVDPNQLAESHIKIIVDIRSISDVYNQLSEALGAPEWFNVKLFPQAIFESTQLVKTGDKTYDVKGNLTIRDKTSPVILKVTQEEYSENKGRVTGTTTIKRTSFGVGEGEWADTKSVKDDVKITFTVSAIKR